MKIAIKAFNGQYVCAELGGSIYFDNGIALRANRQVQSIWEEFEEVPLSGGKFALKTQSGNYVTAEEHKPYLSTNREQIGIWEQFEWVGKKIKTYHGTFITARLDIADFPLEQTINQDIWEDFERIPLEAEETEARIGLVRTEGRCAIDDTGLFHPLGLTFFWGPYGWKFERERIIEHLEWLKSYKFDYLRSLGEVNWPGRTIDPNWPDYEQIIAEYTDTVYKYGMRVQWTMVGGQYQNGQERKLRNALMGREHKVMQHEVCNEWMRLDKISKEDMIRVGKYMRENTPNLVALSSGGPYSEMIKMTKDAGCNSYVLHTRRSDHDHYWSHVRQGYDLKEFPAITWNNEPQGPQSSVDEDSNPLRLAMARATGIVCSGAGYVLHVAQGVTGRAEPERGRPENMWEVPNVDNIMKHVRKVDIALPQGIENWRVANNGRDWHPLPLDPRENKPGAGFWSGDNGEGSVNKNYATVRGEQWCEVLLGVKNKDEKGATWVGNARLNSDLKIFDVRDYSSTNGTITAGQSAYLEGQKDTMIGYVLQGNL